MNCKTVRLSLVHNSDLHNSKAIVVIHELLRLIKEMRLPEALAGAGLGRFSLMVVEAKIMFGFVGQSATMEEAGAVEPSF